MLRSFTKILLENFHLHNKQHLDYCKIHINNSLEQTLLLMSHSYIALITFSNGILVKIHDASFDNKTFVTLCCFC